MQDQGFQNVGNPISPEPSPSPTSQSYQYESPPKRRSPKRFLYLLALVLLVLVVFNILRFLGSKKESAPTPSPTPKVEEFAPVEEATPQPTEEPTPSPTPKAANPVDSATGLDRSELSVRVENGSGAAGVAKKAADFLKSLGYNITKIGNADNSNYKNVIIQVKSSQGDYLPVLIKDLSTEYSVGTTSSTLSATASAEALVIIGK